MAGLCSTRYSPANISGSPMGGRDQDTRCSRTWFPRHTATTFGARVQSSRSPSWVRFSLRRVRGRQPVARRRWKPRRLNSEDCRPRPLTSRGSLVRVQYRPSRVCDLTRPGSRRSNQSGAGTGLQGRVGTPVDTHRRDVVERCERCGTGFNPRRIVAARASCPRCLTRDGVVAYLLPWDPGRRTERAEDRPRDGPDGGRPAAAE